MKERFFDAKRLEEDISRAAARYDMSCMAAITQGDNTLFRSAHNCSYDQFLLDGGGGFLLGLSVLLLCQDGKLSLSDPVSRFVTDRELTLPSELTVERLLRRTSCLPDPLHQRLMTDLRIDGDFHMLLPEEQRVREASSLLDNRGLRSQTALLSDDMRCLGYAPSSLDEALLTSIVLRVSGEPLEELQRTRIFAPLGIAARPGIHTTAPGHITGIDGHPLPFEAPSDTPNLLTLTLTDLEALTAAIAQRRILSCEGWEAAEKLICGTRSLPFGRRGGFLCARSDVAGWTVDILARHSDEYGILIAADRTLPVIRENRQFRRFDLDAAECVSAMTTYPSHTRMERLSARNLSGALSLEPKPGEEEFIPSPAADMAETAADRSRETFVASEQGVIVGMLSFSVDSAANCARLDTILVDRRYRRRGFGSIMLGWVMGHLRQQGVDELVLCTDRRNQPALELYLSNCFELQAVYDNIYVLSVKLQDN